MSPRPAGQVEYIAPLEAREVENAAYLVLGGIEPPLREQERI